MSETSRIVKNTGFLYFRMLFVMAVSLFTSRVILQSLGAEDYGLYNVVAGIVIMLSFINSSASAASSRFLTFALGRKDDPEYDYKKIFSTSFAIHLFIAIAILAVGETLGLWYFYNKMVIPESRQVAAFWVYQISLINILVSFTQVPYNASIIAHEKMSVYAYVGIFETVAKLAVAYIIYICSADKLIVYALLLFSITSCISVFYRIYCIRNFGNDCRLTICKERRLYKRLLCYSGWDLLGCFGSTARSQGVNLVINLFFSLTVNAARTVASQVEAALNSFTANFQTAVRPVIIKHYSAGETEKAVSLLYNTAKYSFFLFSCLAIPIIVECDSVIRLWLVNPPEYTIEFVRIVLIIFMFETVCKSLNIGVHACGDVKTFNIFAGLRVFIELPVIYFLLDMGMSPLSAFYVIFCTTILILIVNIAVLHKNIASFTFTGFMSKTLVPCIIVILLPVLFTVAIHQIEINYVLLKVLMSFAVYNYLLLPMIFFVVLSKDQRQMVLGKVKHVIHK